MSNQSERRTSSHPGYCCWLLPASIDRSVEAIPSSRAQARGVNQCKDDCLRGSSMATIDRSAMLGALWIEIGGR